MKTGVAALVKALESVKERMLKRRLVFVAAGGEEVGYDGMSKLVADGKVTSTDAKYVVIAEPTEMRVVRGHGDAVTLKVTFRGRSAQASRPEFGVNAIENCTKFINELSSMRRELDKEKHADLGSTIITPTVVNGGTKSNVVPESCELTLASRTIPQDSTRDISAGVRSIATKLHQSDGGFRAKVDVMFPSHHLLVHKTDPLVRLMDRITGRSRRSPLTGLKLSSTRVSG